LTVRTKGSREAGWGTN